jgi:hypothetical protein
MAASAKTPTKRSNSTEWVAFDQPAVAGKQPNAHRIAANGRWKNLAEEIGNKTESKRARQRYRSAAALGDHAPADRNQTQLQESDRRCQNHPREVDPVQPVPKPLPMRPPDGEVEQPGGHQSLEKQGAAFAHRGSLISRVLLSARVVQNQPR